MTGKTTLLILVASFTYLLANPIIQVVVDLQDADYRLVGSPGEEFGFSLSVGDLTGDYPYYEDIIIGAPGASSGAGKVYLFLGKEDLTPESPDTRILGDSGVPLGRLGHSVASGDVNGDGMDDLVIGCPGSVEGGRVYVIYGSPGLPDTIDLGLDPPSCLIHAETAGDRLGQEVWVGDLDQDGYEDLFLAAVTSDPEGRADAGKVYVIYGGNDLPDEIFLGTSWPDWAMIGAHPYDSLAASLSIGDLNDDGRPDITLGVPAGDPEGRPGAGKVHLLFGRAVVPKEVVDLRTASDVIFAGAVTADRAGSCVRLEQADNDEISDLMIGSPGSDQVALDGGLVYIFFGKVSFPSEIDLGDDEQDCRIFSSIEGERLGGSITSGWNIYSTGSQWPDFVFGAPNATPVDTLSGTPRMEAGKTYVLLGPMYEGEYDVSYGFLIEAMGSDSLDHSGRPIAAGNVVHTDYGDLIIAAPDAEQGAGEVCVVKSLEIVGIEDGPDDPMRSPRAHLLEQNYPNPFNPSTTIAFFLPGNEEPVRATLEIFSIRGMKVRRLVDGYRTSGSNQIHWDGKDDRGEPVGSGVYLYRLKVEDRIESRKMVIAR